MEGRAAKAQEYTPQLCKAICKGIKKQKEVDSVGMCSLMNMTTNELETVINKAGFPSHWTDEQHDDQLGDDQITEEIFKLGIRGGQAWASDDVSGAVLDPVKVQEARNVEMDYFRKMVVYNKVPRWQSNGHKVIRTKWIDINKGDTVSPDFRSRLVAMEFNEFVDPSLYASTPPLEAMRFMLHRAATNKSGKRDCIMTVDIKRAYFNAVSTRKVFIEIPVEDRNDDDGNVVGELRLCLYGTRDAAYNWSETVASQLRECGYSRGKAFPAVYFNKSKGVALMVHGDDYMCAGSEVALEELRLQLSKSFEIKSAIMGEDAHLAKEGKILNRIVRCTSAGWEMEGDQRHGEIIAKELGLETSKGLTTPGVDEPIPEGDEALTGWQLTQYRSLSARALYLSMDRPDIQFAVKELCRYMTAPTQGSWRMLVRAGKYLRHRPRLVVKYNWQDPVVEITSYSDANWAGCLKSRKSTSGGCLMLGNHLVKSYSKTQTNIALSSAESEFYATMKVCQESIGMISLAKEVMMDIKAKVMVDASAALGVAQRMGIGKIRHLQTGALWIQENELRKHLSLNKIPGADNIADLMTKNVPREILERHVNGLRGKFVEGRADNAVNLHLLARQIRQTKAITRNVLDKKKGPSHTVQEHFSIEMIEEMADNFEEQLMRIELERDRVIESNYIKWTKDQCRQEGLMRQSLDRSCENIPSKSQMKHQYAASERGC